MAPTPQPLTRVRAHLPLPVLIVDKDFRIGRTWTSAISTSPSTSASNLISKSVCDEGPDLGVQDIMNLNVSEESGTLNHALLSGSGLADLGTVMLDIHRPPSCFSLFQVCCHLPTWFETHLNANEIHLTPLDSVVSICMNAVSRRFEWEADPFRSRASE